MPDFHAAWWDVALDPAARADPARAERLDAQGRALVNPATDGRLALQYDRYLHLDRLLDAQEPASRVPDERIFVVTHQLFEVTFKQMIFDLGVVARTMEALLAREADAFRALATAPLPRASDAHGPDPFWRPALTAAARVRHAARRVLPAIMVFLGRGDDDDVLFSSLEFGHFRDFLTPSSGFQAASLRLIQRAFGKTPAFGIALFPGDTFGRHYAGCPLGHVALGNETILGPGHGRAFPAEETDEARVAALDAICHAVLARLAPNDAHLPPPPAVARIAPQDADRLATRFTNTLGAGADHAALERFRADLDRVVAEENGRRDRLDAARRGAQALLAEAPRSCLAFVLDRIVAADAAFHDPGSDSFLTVHRKTVRQHVADDSGTGGGGMPYLVTSQRFLFPLFPALVAYADLAAMASEDAAERW